MLIHIERTGGFAGMRKEFTVDTASLSSEEARMLHEMVEKAGFFNMPAKFPPPKKGADYFQYRLTVETEGKKHTVEVSETETPASLQPLLRSLIKYTKK